MDQTAAALDQLADSALGGVTLDDGSDETQIKVINLIIQHGIKDERRPAGKFLSVLFIKGLY
jgi:cell cycle checkpoint protein MEC1